MSQMPIISIYCSVSRSFETAFEKALSKLVNSKVIAPTLADKAESTYHKFAIGTVKERKYDFLNFDKRVQRLDQFLICCISGTKDFTESDKVFKISLTLSHGQAQVERGFSANAKRLVENQNTVSLITQRIIHDRMRFIKHQVFNFHKEGTSLDNNNVL